MDRTSEFFTAACAQVSGDLRAATGRLASLSRLVRRRGMLGAEAAAADIARQTAACKADLEACARRLDALQAWVDAGGASAASPAAAAAAAAGGAGAGSGSAQGRAHGGAVVAALQGALAAAGAGLADVLRARAAGLAAQAERRHRLVGSSAPRDIGAAALGHAALPRLADGGGGGGGGARAGDAAMDVGGAGAGAAADAHANGRWLGARAGAQLSSPGSSALAPALHDGGGGGGGADPFALVSQAQLLQPADAEAAYLEARAGDVQALEAHISDLGSLFGRLAGLVAQQGEAVARIEDNASSAAASVDAATLQLRRAAQRADAGANGVVAMRVTVVVVFALVLFLLFG